MIRRICVHTKQFVNGLRYHFQTKRSDDNSNVEFPVLFIFIDFVAGFFFTLHSVRWWQRGIYRNDSHRGQTKYG